MISTFIVLLLAKRVFHLALFASLAIWAVLISVVSSEMVIPGWELGTLESILVDILSGFSVHYVVHFAQVHEKIDA